MEILVGDYVTRISHKHDMVFKVIDIIEDTCYLRGMLSREDLAGFANMTASNAIRTLAAFDTEGIIALEGKRIKLLNESQLRKVSLLG